jgi:hypothetical protein
MSLAPNGCFARLRTGRPVDRALVRSAHHRVPRTPSEERLQHVRPTMEELTAGEVNVLSRGRLTVND